MIVDDVDVLRTIVNSAKTEPSLSVYSNTVFAVLATSWRNRNSRFVRSYDGFTLSRISVARIAVIEVDYTYFERSKSELAIAFWDCVEERIGRQAVKASSRRSRRLSAVNHTPENWF